MKRTCNSMGIGQQFKTQNRIKYTNRWLLEIDGIVDNITALPPKESARPTVSTGTIEVEGLTETISYPKKIKWEPLNLVVYDTENRRNLVFEWLRLLTNGGAKTMSWAPLGRSPVEDGRNPSSPGLLTNTNFKKNVTLGLFDGCGEMLEQWIYVNAYPERIEWGSLSMADIQLVTATMTLKYDRAYVVSLVQ